MPCFRHLGRKVPTETLVKAPMQAVVDQEFVDVSLSDYRGKLQPQKVQGLGCTEGLRI